MDNIDDPLFPRDFPQLQWLFQTYLDGNSCREEHLKEEVKDNNGAFKPKLERELKLFLTHRPLRVEDFESEYYTDFASEALFYNYLVRLYDWLYGEGPEPDLIAYLAD